MDTKCLTSDIYMKKKCLQILGENHLPSGLQIWTINQKWKWECGPLSSFGDVVWIVGRSHFQNGNVAGKKGEEVAQSGGVGGQKDIQFVF